MNRKRIWKWTRIILLVYVIIGIGLYEFQDKIIFHPKKLPADYHFNFDLPFKEVNLKGTEEKNINIVQFTVPDSICKGVVLFFHGNRENLIRYIRYVPWFTRNNYEIWMIDYPGFGKSTGKRTEQVLYDDAKLFYKMAIKKCAADSIIIYGKSIGTGIAAQLASVRVCKRLILEAPYYSMDALAKSYFFVYPVSPMTKYEFPTYKLFEYINAPITIFHGTSDGVIPYKQGKRLAKLKTGTELITIERGKHNNLLDFPPFRQKLDSLLIH